MRTPALAIVLIALLSSMTYAQQTTAVLGGPSLKPGKVLIQPDHLPRIKGIKLYPLNYPHTSGSTSAEPLGIWIASRILKRRVNWLSKGEGGQTHLLPYTGGPDKKATTMAQFYNKMRGYGPDKFGSDLYDRLKHDGTHGSYMFLIHGNVDLIFECRLPSEDERKVMAQLGIELDIRPVALDAFVFLKHEKNEVKNLMLHDLIDIYTAGADGKGKTTSWKEFSGVDAPITPYVRNRNSGSQETMISLVMKDRKIVDGTSIKGATMSGPYNRLHRDDKGIGYTFYYYQRYMSPVTGSMGRYGKGRASTVWVPLRRDAPDRNSIQSVRMLAINGVMPNRRNIADGSYPLVTKVYAAIRKAKPKESAVKLRDWLLTSEGQRVVEESGYVPLPKKEDGVPRDK